MLKRALCPAVLTLLIAALPDCNCHNAALKTVCGTSVTPATEDFGAVSINQSLTLPLTILNSGTAPVTIESAVASGDDSFQVQSLSTSQILPGNSVEVQITFNPTVAGQHTATLVIVTDDSCTNPTTTVTLTGIGTSYGVSISPASLDFSCVAVSGTSTAQTVMLTNDSDPPQAETVSITPDTTGNFQLSPATTQISLAAGQTYTFSVVFTPSALGADQASWSIVACGGDGGCPSSSLRLTGTGSSTTLVAVPPSLDFGLVPLGDTATKGIVVQAQALPAGSACAIPLTVDAPTLEFGDAGFELQLDAGWDGGWPAAIVPPEAFPLAVTFTGQDGGEFADVAVVAFSMGGQSQAPLQIPLTAQAGTGPCSLTVMPPSVSFGVVPLGQTVPESVTITNAGTAICEISAALRNDAYGEFGFGSGGAIDFGDGGAIALTPGQPATIGLTFTTESVTPPLLRQGRLSLTAVDVSAQDGGAPVVVGVPLSAAVNESTCTGWVFDGGFTFSAAAIPDLQLWLDANTGVMVDGGQVVGWTDLSSNGFNPLLSDAGQPCDYLPGALNGLPIVSCTQNDAGFEGMIFPSTPLYTAASVFVVYRATAAIQYATQHYDILIFGGPNNIAGDYMFLELGQDPSDTSINSLTDAISIAAGYGDNAWAVANNVGLSGLTAPFQVVDWTTSSVFNTDLYASGNPGQMTYYQNDQPWSFALGTGHNDDVGGLGFSPFDATLSPTPAGYPEPQYGEVLFYNRVLETCERQEVEGYLAWKWGLQSSLPASHPYANGPP